MEDPIFWPFKKYDTREIVTPSGYATDMGMAADPESVEFGMGMRTVKSLPPPPGDKLPGEEEDCCPAHTDTGYSQ